MCSQIKALDLCKLHVRIPPALGRELMCGNQNRNRAHMLGIADALWLRKFSAEVHVLLLHHRGGVRRCRAASRVPHLGTSVQPQLVKPIVRDQGAQDARQRCLEAQEGRWSCGQRLYGMQQGAGRTLSHIEGAGGAPCEEASA
jgi:hypothetical protein